MGSEEESRHLGLRITGTSERSRFLRAITAHSVNRHSASAALEKSGGWVVCDACAVVLAVDPTVAVEVTREHMQVELAGKHTRGQVSTPHYTSLFSPLFLTH